MNWSLNWLWGVLRNDPPPSEGGREPGTAYNGAEICQYPTLCARVAYQAM